MAKKIDYGKRLEEDLENSSHRLNLFNFRVRDVDFTSLKPGRRTAKNKYDYLLYRRPYIIPTELKSTKEKTFSFAGSNPKIKEHQIEALTKDNKYDGAIGGLLLNFRTPENRLFFIHIDKFNDYTQAAENNIQDKYKAKINQSSIPLRICEEIGIEVESELKKTRYHYRIDKLFDRLIEEYGGE